tara:strand:+ start:218 stop:439 length:222 start_codon:yes stop_codon:yes gene_type:complete
MNIHFEYWTDDEGEIDTKLTLTGDGFCKLSEELEELFESFGLTREQSQDEFAEIRFDLIDCFQTQINKEKDNG